MNRNFLLSIWNFELYKSGNNSIRINQIVIAFTIIIVGSFISKKIVLRIKNALKKTGSFTENSLHLIQKSVNNIFTLITIFIALPIAGIPMTVFTVLGGALAIGIGFGAQNLFNNLISSLFILIEKPIRIGDIIELSGEKGYVADIGNRCTRIRRVDGIDVLIPNSYFLEQPVVNWTLYDKDIRGKIVVGVAYGSDITLVKDIMSKVAYNYKKIDTNKSIKVIFDDFGESALIFELYFWTKVNSPLELKEIMSDMRFEIERLFRENNIEIPFPQIDVHMRNK